MHQSRHRFVWCEAVAAPAWRPGPAGAQLVDVAARLHPSARRRAGRQTGHQPVLPATGSGRVLEGPALEDVLFMRDEMANLAWAIERRIESPIEKPVQRDALMDASKSAPPRDITSGEASGSEFTGPLRYRLASEVPANWVPLLPVQTLGADGNVVLACAAARYCSRTAQPYCTPRLAGYSMPPTRSRSTTRRYLAKACNCHLAAVSGDGPTAVLAYGPHTGDRSDVGKAPADCGSTRSSDGIQVGYNVERPSK